MKILHKFGAPGALDSKRLEALRQELGLGNTSDHQERKRGEERLKRLATALGSHEGNWPTEQSASEYTRYTVGVTLN